MHVLMELPGGTRSLLEVCPLHVGLCGCFVRAFFKSALQLEAGGCFLLGKIQTRVMGKKGQLEIQTRGFQEFLHQLSCASTRLSL